MIKPDPYAALRIPDYRRFLSTRLMTTLTIQIMSVSVGYYVYELTNDPVSSRASSMGEYDEPLPSMTESVRAVTDSV